MQNISHVLPLSLETIFKKRGIDEMKKYENKYERIVKLAQQVADKISNFHTVKGPGRGDKATDRYLKKLREKVKSELGSEFSGKGICGESNKLEPDFYVPKEKTIVEVALSLRNSNSEFERDIFKAFLAQRCGKKVERLIFISKHGASGCHEQPSSKAIMDWVKKEHGISIEIRDLSK